MHFQVGPFTFLLVTLHFPRVDQQAVEEERGRGEKKEKLAWSSVGVTMLRIPQDAHNVEGSPYKARDPTTHRRFAI